MIDYLGSKQKLIPYIFRIVRAISKEPIFFYDIFSGSCRVSDVMKKWNYKVMANDHNHFAYNLAKTFIEADSEQLNLKTLENNINILNNLQPCSDWFTENYCIKAQYFQDKNAMKIDAIRKFIENFNGEEKAIYITALIIAANKIINCAGQQDAFIKGWLPRTYKNINLELPLLNRGWGNATRYDAENLVSGFSVEDSILYLDPPYNRRNYLACYHIWETLTLWDYPETYGITNKRVDVRERKSSFNSKANAASAMNNLISKVTNKNTVVSFNNEGYITYDDMFSMLGQLGFVQAFEVSHNKYIGAEPIDRLRDKKVKEYLFVTDYDQDHLKIITRKAKNYPQ